MLAGKQVLKGPSKVLKKREGEQKIERETRGAYRPWSQ